MQQNNVVEQKLILEANKNLSMTGVETVDGFTEQSLKLTVAGSKMFIVGENIKITAFNKTSGNLTAEGEFFEIKYNRKKVPVIKRLFK